MWDHGRPLLPNLRSCHQVRGHVQDMDMAATLTAGGPAGGRASTLTAARQRRVICCDERRVNRQVLPRPVAQRDTLVLSEHRGNRLGMLIKIDNIQALTESHPGHPAITTGNAEENRYMLSVNEAVGFTALAYESAWRKVLKPAVG